MAAKFRLVLPEQLKLVNRVVYDPSHRELLLIIQRMTKDTYVRFSIGEGGSSCIQEDVSPEDVAELLRDLEATGRTFKTAPVAKGSLIQAYEAAFVEIEPSAKNEATSAKTSHT